MNRKSALKVEKLTKIYTEKSSKEIKALKINGGKFKIINEESFLSYFNE